MYKCNCGKEFEKQGSLNSHARFCDLYIKKEKKKSKYKKEINLYECECGKQFVKSQGLNAHFSHCLIHRNGKSETRKSLKKGKMIGWGKFSNDDLNAINKKVSNTLLLKYKNNEIINPFQNKRHTTTTKEKMSKSYSNSGRNNHGHVRFKYYEVFCPYENKNVKVQGTWELTYANYLNKNNINWTRNTKLNYKLFETDYVHTYYPDFYLIDSDEYIEIKGYWWKSQDGKRDDKIKMDKVKEYNINKKITIIRNINDYK